MTHFSSQTDLPTDAYSTTPTDSPAESGSSIDRKKVLGISAAALLLGGAAWAIQQKTLAALAPAPESGVAAMPESQPSADLPAPDTDTPPSLPATIDVAGKVTNRMSFEQAFEAAREEVGMGGVFGWQGHWYNTFNEDEWSSLSLDQRQEFTEMIMQEKLPVQVYASSVSTLPTGSQQPHPAPTLIEGQLNGHRVIGLDFDLDGVIDTLVMEGADGYTYRVVDATGDDGLDTLFQFDALSGELVEVEKLDAPFVLSNDQFSRGLETSMSTQTIESVLDDEPVNPILETGDETDELDDESADEEDYYLTESVAPDDTHNLGGHHTEE